MIPNSVNPSENKPIINPVETPAEQSVPEISEPLSDLESPEVTTQEVSLSPEVAGAGSESVESSLSNVPAPEAASASVVNTNAPESVIMTAPAIEKHLADILENEDFKIVKPHDAMEDILNASGPSI